MADQTDVFVYCDREEVERIMSSAAVAQYIDNNDDGTDETAEDAIVDDCLIEATEFINLYCGRHYTVPQLARSNWVERIATRLTVYYLCLQRCNPVPESVLAEFERIEEQLKEVRDGALRIPGIGLKRSKGPVWSNFYLDPRYSRRVIRVERSTSSRRSNRLKRSPDYTDGGLYEH